VNLDDIPLVVTRHPWIYPPFDESSKPLLTAAENAALGSPNIFLDRETVGKTREMQLKLPSHGIFSITPERILHDWEGNFIPRNGREGKQPDL
jgi:hypothetical protein